VATKFSGQIAQFQAPPPPGLASGLGSRCEAARAAIRFWGSGQAGCTEMHYSTGIWQKTKGPSWLVFSSLSNPPLRPLRFLPTPQPAQPSLTEAAHGRARQQEPKHGDSTSLHVQPPRTPPRSCGCESAWPAAPHCSALAGRCRIRPCLGGRSSRRCARGGFSPDIPAEMPPPPKF
jgi:hypothetical protein